jgi:hypothetical protein|tara:strand:+ start:1604 stop:1819 length:216 start_codon:yes stop_codon:yes gene_type:complete
MKEMKSSLIKSIGYNPLTEELSVVLHNQPNTIWNYNGVSRKTLNDFNNSESKGKYFNNKIKGHFPMTKAVI